MMMNCRVGFASAFSMITLVAVLRFTAS